MTIAAQTELAAILSRYEGRRRDALLPILWEVQTAYGHLDSASIHTISHALHVPEAEIYGVIEFYSLFYTEPTGETIIRVCTDPSCGLAGADDVLHKLCHRLNIGHGETTPDGKYTVEHTTCVGMCNHAPAALISQRGIGESLHGNITDIDSLLSDSILTAHHDVMLSDLQVLLSDAPQHTLTEYGDYAALRHTLTAFSPETIIEMVEHSGLVGRGGAAFPTGSKWKYTRQAIADQRYVVCNADESEPGTFKDRVLMESRPHQLLEGMAIAAYAIGATYGYLFIRGEYGEAARILQAALSEAETAGLLGEHILGTDFSFHIEIRRGGGAYICGEETALFEAIEGKRGFPRIKPPFPTTHGLFYKPTAINNVETLSVVPSIITNGADWFRQFGTEKSTGPKLLCVSGHVNRPGVYEIAMGMTLRDLLENHCQGIVGNLHAVLMGGAAGTFLTAAEIDVPLTFEALREVGCTLGSGAVMVFNNQTDLRDVLKRLARFFQHESCGKCFPCQLGTQRQMEILERMEQPYPGDAQRLQDIGLTMHESSLCGLGQTAASAILSAIERFPELFENQGLA